MRDLNKTLTVEDVIHQSRMRQYEQLDTPLDNQYL